MEQMDSNFIDQHLCKLRAFEKAKLRKPLCFEDR